MAKIYTHIYFDCTHKKVDTLMNPPGAARLIFGNYCSLLVNNEFQKFQLELNLL